MYNLCIKIVLFILAFVMGLLLANYLEIKSPLYQGFIIASIYLLISFPIYQKQLENVDQVSNNVVQVSNNGNENTSIQPDNGVQEQVGVQEHVGVQEQTNQLNSENEDPLPNLTTSNTGPLDNLSSFELQHNLAMMRKYSAKKSNLEESSSSDQLYPFESDKENDQRSFSRSDSQELLVNSHVTHVSHRILKDNEDIGNIDPNHPKNQRYLKLTAENYPSLTKRQINFDDCTNHQSGPNSCIIHPNNQNLYPVKSDEPVPSFPLDTPQSVCYSAMNLGDNSSYKGNILDSVPKNEATLIEDFSLFQKYRMDEFTKPIFKNAPKKYE